MGRRWVLRYGSLAAIVVFWELVVRAGLVPPYLLPAPSAVLLALYDLTVTGIILPHAGISLFRSLTGFFIGAACGIAVGALMGWSRTVYDLADAPLQILRAVPLAALVPLGIVWLGLGEGLKLFLVGLPPFFLTLINTMQGVRNVDPTLVKAARNLGAGKGQILVRVLVPAASPMIFAGLRLGVVVSLVMLVIAEMIAAGAGLGHFILESQRLWHTEAMFAGIVLMSALGFAFDRAVLWAERKLLVWNRGTRAW